MDNLYTYRHFELAVGCEFPLPELPQRTNTTSSPAVRIQEVSKSDLTTGISPHSISCIDHNFQNADTGGIRCRNGEEVSVAIEDEVTPRIRWIVLGSALGTILVQRGDLVLHGDVVSISDDAAIAILGPSGAGKSTTAAAFDTAGYPILSDDIVDIRYRDGIPTVYPGVPNVKLRQETATELGFDSPIASDQPSNHNRSKRYYPSRERGSQSPRELIGVYILADGPQLSIEELDGTDGIMEVIRQTHLINSHDGETAREHHLDQCATLTADVPIKRLTRPRVLDQLPQVREHVLSDIQCRIEG